MMVTRAALAVALAFGVLAAPLTGEAQQAGNIPRLCFLTFDPGTAQSPSPRFEAFFQGLRDLGYVHGQTITIDYLVAKAVASGFPPSLLNVCASRRTSSWSAPLRPLTRRRTQPARSRLS